MSRRSDDIDLSGLPERPPSAFVMVQGERDYCFVGPFDDVAEAETWIAIVTAALPDDCAGFSFLPVTGEQMRASVRDHGRVPVLHPKRDLTFH